MGFWAQIGCAITRSKRGIAGEFLTLSCNKPYPHKRKPYTHPSNNSSTIRQSDLKLVQDAHVMHTQVGRQIRCIPRKSTMSATLPALSISQFNTKIPTVLLLQQRRSKWVQMVLSKLICHDGRCSLLHKKCRGEVSCPGPLPTHRRTSTWQGRRDDDCQRSTFIRILCVKLPLLKNSNSQEPRFCTALYTVKTAVAKDATISVVG